MQIRANFTKSVIVDVGVYLTILVGAWIHFYSAWLGMVPFAWNAGDVQNALAFAAASEMPGHFEGDLVLDDPANYRTYWAFQYVVIKLLTSVAGDSGTAAIWMLPLQVGLYGCAWYLFGRIVFRSAGWAFVLLIANVATVYIGIGTYWGILQASLPRQTFSALLPLLLLAVWHYRRVPTAKPWLMFAAGLLLYTHAVSGVTVGFAIFVALLWFWPSGMTTIRRLSWILFSGVVFLVTLSPFAVHYLSTYESGVTNLDLQAVIEAMKFRYVSNLLEPETAIIRFFRIWVSTGLLPLACIAAAWLWRREAERETLIIFLSLLGGVLLFSILVPIIDHKIASVRGAIPAQVDVIRTIRYAIPFSLLIVVLGFCVAFREAPDRVTRVSVGVVAVLVTTLYLITNPPGGTRNSLGYIAGIYPTQKVIDYNRNWLDLLATVRTTTPADARIGISAGRRTNTQYFAVRYLAHRSLVYTWKDGGILAYSNHERLLQWFERSRNFRKVKEIENPVERVESLVALVRGWGATHLILDEADRLEPQTLPARTRLAYENANFQLLELTPVSNSARQRNVEDH